MIYEADELGCTQGASRLRVGLRQLALWKDFFSFEEWIKVGIFFAATVAFMHIEHLGIGSGRIRVIPGCFGTIP